MVLSYAGGRLLKSIGNVEVRGNRMSVNPSDKGLLTPDNCVVLFIDHQPQMFMGVASIFRQVLLKNLLVLANAAKIFSVPVVLTAIESKEFKGELFPELLELFPDEEPIKRSSMNSWESPAFVAKVKKTGRRNLVIAAPWTEVCLAMPALQALTDGYFVYAVEDASGGLSPAGHRRPAANRASGRCVGHRPASAARIPTRLGTP